MFDGDSKKKVSNRKGRGNQERVSARAHAHSRFYCELVALSM